MFLVNFGWRVCLCRVCLCRVCFWLVNMTLTCVEFLATCGPTDRVMVLAEKQAGDRMTYLEQGKNSHWMEKKKKKKTLLVLSLHIYKYIYCVFSACFVFLFSEWLR